MKIDYHTTTIHSPVGKLKLVATDNGLAAILWEKDNSRRVRLGTMIENKKHPILKETQKQLGEYFAGKRKKFSIKFDRKGTDFQNSVWRALWAIPFGQTRSYRDIAVQIKNIKGVRAVGGAIGKNPLGIIVPCHRVISVSGKLTGFAGGLDVKRQLLSIESIESIL